MTAENLISRNASPESSTEVFLRLSAILTGFSAIELLGTGCSREYFETVTSAAGEVATSALWEAAHEIQKNPAAEPASLETEVRNGILSDPMFGPVARSILKMWMLGRWERLPDGWRRRFGAHENDVDHVISVRAYQEGLVWRTIGSHPAGAKAPGFASWTLPPGLPS